MTGQASKVSKGLRSIGANVVKLADDTGVLGYSVNGVAKSLSLFDEQGKALSTFDVLSKVAQDWDKMTQAEQSSLALAQAGKTQIDVYTSVLSNFDTALKANKTALSSQGSAMKENQAYMESMGAKLNLLKAQFEKLVLSGGVISKLIKSFLDLSISLLKFANTDTGGVLIALTSLTIGFVVITKAIDELLTRLALMSIGIQKEAISAAIANGYTLGYAGSIKILDASFKKLTATMMANPIGLIAIGVVAAIAGIVLLHKHVTEVDTSLKDLHETTTGFKEELTELEVTISSISSRLDEIKDKKLEITDQSQLDLLNQEQKALEQQLITAEALQKTKREEASKSAEKALNTKVTAVNTSTSYNTEDLSVEVTRSEGLAMTIAMMKELDTEIAVTKSAMSNMEMQNQKDTALYKEKASRLEELNKIMDAQNVAIPELTQQLSDEASQLDLTKESNKKLYDEIQKVIEQSNDYFGVGEQKIALSEEEKEANEENADSVKTLAEAHEELMDSTNDVVSSMDLANEAMQEQAENGELSADTAMKLIEAGYAGALAYDAETNSVMLDREAMALLVQAKLENQIANLELANSGLADILINEGNAAVVSATGYNILALAKMDAMNAGSGGAGNQFINNQKQIDVLNSKLDDLKTKGTGAFGAVGKSAGGASKSVQTLEDKVKSATNYMKSMIDKEIKALREAKEAEEERVEAEIDALKERREAQEAYWDAKIEKVKKANEILEEQNKLQELEQNLALAKSKKVKVFTGEGFEYKEDVDAVSKASQELSDYKREQQIAKEVERLEELKKKALANIDKQIKGWEKYKKEMQKNFDAQIKALENYKDQLDDLTNGYKEQQDKLIAEQLLGAKLEQGNWQLRIDNLKKFVKEYNGELSGIKTDIDTKGTEKSTEGSKAGMPSNIPKHASGSYAVPTDEIAIVGDSPNRELSIGSKLNMGGVMARLKGGTGIMPNTLTERLVSMAYNTNTTPTNNSSVININVDKVELPSVTNGKTFVNDLIGLKTLAIQTSS